MTQAAIHVLLCLTAGHPELAAGPAVVDICPPDFADRAFEHVECLAALGLRRVESPTEIKTAQYMTRRFEIIDLETRVEWFEFESYRVERLVMALGGRDNQSEFCQEGPV